MNQPNRRRRPVEGGYARGEETRLRIVRVAIRLFGRLGFESASTREIAAEAGVNPPALQYYFDSKEGLYRACAEHIVEQISLAMDPVMLRARRLLGEAVDGEALIGAYADLMGDFAGLLFCSPQGLSWAPFLAREQAGLEPDIAYPLLREGFIDPLHILCSELLGQITGKPAQAPETLLRMMAINGQFLVFHIGRAGMLASLGWTEIGPEHGGFIKSMVIDHTRALLAADVRTAKGPFAAVRSFPGLVGR